MVRTVSLPRTTSKFLPLSKMPPIVTDTASSPSSPNSNSFVPLSNVSVWPLILRARRCSRSSFSSLHLPSVSFTDLPSTRTSMSSPSRTSIHSMPPGVGSMKTTLIINSSPASADVAMTLVREGSFFQGSSSCVPAPTRRCEVTGKSSLGAVARKAARPSSVVRVCRGAAVAFAWG